MQTEAKVDRHYTSPYLTLKHQTPLERNGITQHNNRFYMQIDLFGDGLFSECRKNVGSLNL